jgi:4-hydroxybenzoate polyprenyltransferase
VAMAAARVGARRGTPMLVLETMRPRQWVKNVFVLGGLVFAGETLHADKVGIALVVFAAFCLASSAAYLVNDVMDMEADRHARRTASRPIARGDLAPRTALVAAAVAALVAVGITAAVSNWQTLLTLTGFVALQAAYSYKLKHVLIVDVMAIAAGFVLRAYAGLISIEVRFSVWLLLCTGLIALYLALGKRRGEAVALGGAAAPQRRVLEGYSVGLIDELTRVVTPSIVVSYALYAVLGAETQLMGLTVPFVLYGVFRVLYLIHLADSALPDDPTELVWRDRPLQLCIVLWGLTAGVITLAA